MSKNASIMNLDKLYTTEIGVERIKENLKITVNDVVKWCCDRINNSDATIEQ